MNPDKPRCPVILDTWNCTPEPDLSKGMQTSLEAIKNMDFSDTEPLWVVDSLYPPQFEKAPTSRPTKPGLNAGINNKKRAHAKNKAKFKAACAARRANRKRVK